MPNSKYSSPLRLSSELTPTRLLIVDNELPYRSDLAHALRLSDCLIEETASATEALARLEKNCYDLLLVDTHLADMSGAQFLTKMRQLQPETILIVLTRRATLDSAIAAVKAGAVDYLTKPIPLRYMVQVVQRGLERRADQLQRRRLVQAISHVLDKYRQDETTMVSPGSPAGIPARYVQTHSLKLDRQRRLLTIRAEKEVTLHLTESETDIMASLMTYPEQVLSCHDLARSAWGIDLPEDQAQTMIRPHIFRLRQKVENVLKTQRLIHTLRRRGYYFSSKES